MNVNITNLVKALVALGLSEGQIKYHVEEITSSLELNEKLARCAEESNK